MSGGFFDYDQDRIRSMADRLSRIIDSEECGTSDFYSAATIAEFKRGLDHLRRAYVYARRIDWLVSADDSEEAFHRRLREELDKLDPPENMPARSTDS